MWFVITLPLMPASGTQVLICSLNSMFLMMHGLSWWVIADKAHSSIVYGGIALSPIACTRCPSMMSSTGRRYPHNDILAWERFHLYWPIARAGQKPPFTGWRPSQRASDVDLWYFPCFSAVRRIKLLKRQQGYLRFGMPWASYQIHNIAGYAYTGNAGNVFPSTDFKENR